MIKAVFAVAIANGQVAAVTRDKGNVRFGLPGGKVDAGEDLVAALLREAREEGWLLFRARLGQIIHQQVVDDKFTVSWIAYNGNPIRLTTYKEQYRGIVPCWISTETIKQTGMGNDVALAKV